MPIEPKGVSRHQLAWYKRRTFAERERIDPAPSQSLDLSSESYREVWDMQCMGLSACEIAEDCGVDESLIIAIRNDARYPVTKEVHGKIHAAFMDRQREGTKVFTHLPAAASTKASRQRNKIALIRSRMEGT